MFKEAEGLLTGAHPVVLGLPLPRPLTEATRATKAARNPVPWGSVWLLTGANPAVFGLQLPALLRWLAGQKQRHGTPWPGVPCGFSRVPTRLLVGQLPALLRRPPGQSATTRNARALGRSEGLVQGAHPPVFGFTVPAYVEFVGGQPVDAPHHTPRSRPNAATDLPSLAPPASAAGSTLGVLAFRWCTYG